MDNSKAKSLAFHKKNPQMVSKHNDSWVEEGHLAKLRIEKALRVGTLSRGAVLNGEDLILVPKQQDGLPVLNDHPAFPSGQRGQRHHRNPALPHTASLTALTHLGLLLLHSLGDLRGFAGQAPEKRSGQKARMAADRDEGCLVMGR